MLERESERLENAPPCESTAKPIVDRSTTTTGKSNGRHAVRNSSTFRFVQMGPSHTYPDDDHVVNTRNNGHDSDYFRRRPSPRPNDHRTGQSVPYSKAQEPYSSFNGQVNPATRSNGGFFLDAHILLVVVEHEKRRACSHCDPIQYTRLSHA